MTSQGNAHRSGATSFVSCNDSQACQSNTYRRQNRLLMTDLALDLALQNAIFCSPRMVKCEVSRILPHTTMKTYTFIWHK
jgi:hypothetical protein